MIYLSQRKPLVVTLSWFRKEGYMIYVEITLHDPRIGFYKVVINGEDYYASAEVIMQAFGLPVSREYSIYVIRKFHELHEVEMRKMLGI